MARAPTPAELLAARFCRPQRVGLFGYRGVGKTTLVTVLYREAVGGRLSPLRLAAADARTAHYLSDKVLELEAGRPLPATLPETDLRFHLYQQGTRLELVLRDYQGEHIELGRDEPIGAFLRDCDALWICFDAARLDADAERLKRQQEVEQLLEAYLAGPTGTRHTLDRPVAVVFTKGDLLPAGLTPDEVATDHFGMTRFTLETHCPNSGLFMVSCLAADGRLSPRNLDTPLTWLVSALQKQDEARLEQLWCLAGRDVRLLARCVGCFARRYPDASATRAYQQRLRELRRGRVRRRLLTAITTAACLLGGLWTYDAFGYSQVRRFQARHADDAVSIREQWQSFQSWHPTRHLLRPGAAEAETEELDRLDQQVRRQHADEALADLRHRSADDDADPETLWEQYRRVRDAYPEVAVPDDVRELLVNVSRRRQDCLAQRERLAYDDFVTAEGQASSLQKQIDLTERFLHDHPGAAQAEEVRRRRDAYLLRLDERAIEGARTYSAQNPFNFQTRREHYQAYLDRDPNGRFADEATAALRHIDEDWDKHDFRSVRDHFQSRPGDTGELVTRCRAYLAVHADGRFANSARELLRWTEQVTAAHEYRVVLRDAQFDKKVAHYFSKGPKLSVELEVNGVRYGPSPIVLNRYDPEWNYEFPRPVRWKLGDPVRIRVTEHSWKAGVVVEMASGDGDPLALSLLAGEAWSGKNRLTFACPDFRVPVLPKIE